MILWMSRKQRSIILSTTEAEYIATNELVLKQYGSESYLQDSSAKSWN